MQTVSNGGIRRPRIVTKSGHARNELDTPTMAREMPMKIERWDGFSVMRAGEARYSPAQCMGARKATITGSPDIAVTPAMEAGISDHVWSLEEIVGLLP